MTAALSTLGMICPGSPATAQSTLGMICFSRVVLTVLPCTADVVIAVLDQAVTEISVLNSASVTDTVLDAADVVVGCRR